MQPNELKNQIVNKYGFLYIFGDFKSKELDCYTIEGINKFGYVYVDAQLSDGKVKRVVCDDFSDMKMCILLSKEEKRRYEEESGLDLPAFAEGRMPELRFQGVPWEAIFWYINKNIKSSKNSEIIIY